MPDEKDLEFATKEDLDAIMADERLRRYYNATRAGVNKKFQEWSEREKELKAKLDEAYSALNAWEQWRPVVEYVANNPDVFTQGSRYQEPQQPAAPSPSPQQPEVTSQLSQLISAVQQLATAMEQAKSEYDHKIEALERTWDLSMQLNDLQRQYPDVDVKRVLTRAQKERLADLMKAYNLEYHDDIVKKQVETQVKEKEKELREKMKAPRDTGAELTQPLPLKFPSPDKPRSSWTDVSKSVISEIKEGKLGSPPQESATPIPKEE